MLCQRIPRLCLPHVSPGRSLTSNMTVSLAAPVPKAAPVLSSFPSGKPGGPVKLASLPDASMMRSEH